MRWIYDIKTFLYYVLFTKNKTLSLGVTFRTEWISRSSIFTSANIWKLWLIINNHQTGLIAVIK